jgi:hypothetical protein
VTKPDDNAAARSWTGAMIFSAPMVQALLQECVEPGTGKTQTRRVLSPGHCTVDGSAPGEIWDNLLFTSPDVFVDNQLAYLYGRAMKLKVPHRNGETIHRVRVKWEPGARIRVKEAWAHAHDNVECDNPGCTHGYIYRADYSDEAVAMNGLKFKPSMFMLESATRLALTLTRTRIQRLHEIDDADAIAEGMRRDAYQAGYKSPRGAYEQLWRLLNKEPGKTWDDNPWVIVYDFTPERLRIL